MIPIATALLAALWYALRSESRSRARKYQNDHLTRLQARRAIFQAYRYINSPIDWRD